MSGAYFYYDFYAVNFVQVLLPFSLLLCLNVAIIRSLASPPWC